MSPPATPPTTDPGAEPATTTGDVGPLVADLALVALFAAIGRRSHGEQDAVTGVLLTAWPFLTGVLLGWSLVVLLRRTGRRLPGRSLPAGAAVLAGAVVGGMLLRRLVAGGGTPVSFLVVATTVLAVFLVGWRAAVRLRRGPA